MSGTAPGSSRTDPGSTQVAPTGLPIDPGSPEEPSSTDFGRFGVDFGRFGVDFGRFGFRFRPPRDLPTPESVIRITFSCISAFSTREGSEEAAVTFQTPPGSLRDPSRERPDLPRSVRDRPGTLPDRPRIDPGSLDRPLRATKVDPRSPEDPSSTDFGRFGVEFR